MAGDRSFKKTIRKHWAFSAGLILTIGGAVAVTAACFIWPAFITGLLAFTLSVGALTVVPLGFMAGIVAAPLIAQALAVGFVALCGLAATFFIFNSVVATYNALDKLFNPQEPQDQVYLGKNWRTVISTPEVDNTTTRNILEALNPVTSVTVEKEISTSPQHYPPVGSMQKGKPNTNPIEPPVSSNQYNSCS